jgi:histidine triad (HIT) family protein
MSLDDVYDRQNIFAKIIRGEIPCAKVFEDGEVLAFMDAFPQTRGHTLVISKTAEASNLLDVDPPSLTSVILGVQRVARAIRSALKPDGLVITQFNGAAAGQTVFHLHFHIIPRWKDVGMDIHGKSDMADIADLQNIAKLITESIA